MHRAYEVGKFFKGYDLEVGNFIYITHHDYTLVGHCSYFRSIESLSRLEASKNTIALVLFTAPWIFILGGLGRSHDDVYNLMPPLFVSFFIFLKEQGFGSAYMI
jgi:hypothetical protein